MNRTSSTKDRPDERFVQTAQSFGMCFGIQTGLQVQDELEKLQQALCQLPGGTRRNISDIEIVLEALMAAVPETRILIGQVLERAPEHDDDPVAIEMMSFNEKEHGVRTNYLFAATRRRAKKLSDLLVLELRVKVSEIVDKNMHIPDGVTMARSAHLHLQTGDIQKVYQAMHNLRDMRMPDTSAYDALRLSIAEVFTRSGITVNDPIVTGSSNRETEAEETEIPQGPYLM